MSGHIAPCWARLGLEPTTDTSTIRRAYARELKQVHPEEDPEGFQALRAAYESALQEAAWMEEDAAAAEVDSDYVEAEVRPEDYGTVVRIEPNTADNAGAEEPPYSRHDFVAKLWREAQANDDTTANDPADASHALPVDHEHHAAQHIANEAVAATEAALRTAAVLLNGPRLEDSEIRGCLDAVVDAIQGLPVDAVSYYTDCLVHLVLDADDRVNSHLTHLQRRLGWDRTDAVAPWNQPRERLAERIAGRDFLLSVRIPNAPMAPAWGLLNEARPLARTLQLMRHPTRAGLALALLERLENETPYAVEELPTASVAFWKRWRDVGVWRPWVNNWIAAFLAIGLLGALGGDRKEPALVWLGLAGVTALLGALWLYGVERPAKQGLRLPEWLRSATAGTLILWPVGLAAFEPLPASGGIWLVLVFLPLAAGVWTLAVTRPYQPPGTERVGIKVSLQVNLFWHVGVGLWLLAVAGMKNPDTQPPSPTLLATLAVGIIAMAAMHGELLRAWFLLADRLRFQLLGAMASWCVLLFGWLHFSAAFELAPASWLMLAVLTSLGMRSLLFPGMDGVRFRGWMSAAAAVAGWFIHARLARLTGAPADYGPAAALLAAAVFEAGHHAWVLRRDIAAADST